MPNESNMTVGDAVYLKNSATPSMTIIEIDKDIATCAWPLKNDIKIRKFPLAALRLRELSARDLSDNELLLIAAFGHPDQLSDAQLIKLFHYLRNMIDNRGLKIE
jgi:hypothetical protein